MTVRITRFAGEFAALAVWTGDSEDQLRADEDYHAADREHWLAWDGDLVIGALHPWQSPDGRLRLYYDKCRARRFERQQQGASTYLIAWTADVPSGEARSFSTDPPHPSTVS